MDRFSPGSRETRWISLILNALTFAAIIVLLAAGSQTIARVIAESHLLAEARLAQERSRSGRMELGQWLDSGSDSHDSRAPALLLVTSVTRPIEDPVLVAWRSLAEKLASVERELRVELLVVGAATGREAWIRQAEQLHARLSVVNDAAEFKARLGITVVPFTVLTDREGRIRRAAAGALGPSDVDWFVVGVHDTIPRFRNGPDLTVVGEDQ